MERARIPLLILLAAFLVLQAGFSLQWPIAHDEAPLFYEAYLMHVEDRLPYKDLYDFQMPGSFAAYYLLGALARFDPFRIRLLDLMLLSALLVMTYRIMRPAGIPAALAGGILFGLHYLQGGASMALQREYLLLLFLAAGLWIGTRGSLSPARRFAFGFFFGLAGTIKPHAVIGLTPFLFLDVREISRTPGVSFLRALAVSIPFLLIGAALPLTAVLLWLGAMDALGSFLDIARNYWPLYAQIDGLLEVRDRAGRTGFILDQIWRLGGNGYWLIPAAIGVWLAPQDFKRPAGLIAGLAVCYALYPALTGQFFPYHFLPFVYFILLLSSLCLSRISSQWRPAAALVLFLAILLNVRPSAAFLQQIEGKPVVTSTDRAGEIRRFLEANLEAGETVQPLDWTGGTLLAMLQARAPLATRYVFDFYFYHHVSEPYIQSLRADFVSQLQEARPRFIIEVTAMDKPWVNGEDTSREFPQLRALLNRDYFIRLRRDDYQVHERK